MPPPVIHQPLKMWTNQDLVLFHGTVQLFAEEIVSGPIHVSKGEPLADFGPGFYTTTSERQARSWANQKAKIRAGTSAALVELLVPREAIARLATISFVRGDADAGDFWSLILHCRGGGSDHRRMTPNGCYDVVFGPVAKAWYTRRAILAGMDQVSFHTTAAETVLNGAARRIL